MENAGEKSCILKTVGKCWEKSQILEKKSRFSKNASRKFLNAGKIFWEANLSEENFCLPGKIHGSFKLMENYWKNFLIPGKISDCGKCHAELLFVNFSLFYCHSLPFFYGIFPRLLNSATPPPLSGFARFTLHLLQFDGIFFNFFLCGRLFGDY